MKALLEQFLSEECTEDVRHLLEATFADSAVARPHFEFNRFENSIERELKVVVLEEVLDATEAGI